MKRLAVIPSDALDDYIQGGYSTEWLENYYNPCKFFDEVYVLSPLEHRAQSLMGMQVVPTPIDQLSARIKELKIDCVRAYGGKWSCQAACEHKVQGVPVVVSVHDRRKEYLSGSIKGADVVWCVSPVVRDLVVTKVKDKERVWILPNRVDFDMMKAKFKPGFNMVDPKGQFKHTILCVGRLSPEKNIDTLIKAMKFLSKDYGLLIVGNGDQGPYQQIAREQGLTDQIRFISRIPQEELAYFYTACSCLCTPSRDEGFGMVFIEALACEAVVVTSDIAPMNQMIRDGHNGILVKDYEDPQILAMAITRACTDQGLRATIKGAARPSVACYERATIDALEAAFYQKVLSMNTEGAFHV